MEDVVLWLLPIAAAIAGDAGPLPGFYSDAALTAAGGFVGFGPGVAVRGSTTVAWWGWAHADGLVALRHLDEPDGAAPFGLVGLEAGFTPPVRGGFAGAAVAIDTSWDDEPALCGGIGRGCLSPYGGLGVGAAWTLHRERRHFEAFVGAGVYSHFDIISPSWRVRLAWTFADHVRLGLVGTGKQDLLVEAGVAW